MSHDYAAQESSPGRWVWACGTCVAVGMGAPTETACDHEHAMTAYSRNAPRILASRARP